jgi:hypothetical protein
MNRSISQIVYNIRNIVHLSWEIPIKSCPSLVYMCIFFPNIRKYKFSSVSWTPSPAVLFRCVSFLIVFFNSKCTHWPWGPTFELESSVFVLYFQRAVVVMSFECCFRVFSNLKMYSLTFPSSVYVTEHPSGMTPSQASTKMSTSSKNVVCYNGIVSRFPPSPSVFRLPF